MADSFWSWPASHVLPVFFCLLGAQLPMRGRLIYVSQSADNTGVRLPRVNVFYSSMPMAGMALAEASSVTVKAPPLTGRVVVGSATSAVPGHRNQRATQISQLYQ